MSCRYWSKAPEGLARKKALALPPFDRAIARAPTVECVSLTGELSANGANIGITCAWCKCAGFSTSQILCALHACAICPLTTPAVDNFHVDDHQRGAARECGDVHSCVGSCWRICD